ncbi:sigma factor [Nocardia yunnanensis]|nr:sigma factor [Nocardia yunnanensis]
MSDKSPPTSTTTLDERRGTDDIEPLLVRLAARALDDEQRDALRDELIGRCLPLAEYIASKLAVHGENFDEIRRCARARMVLAVDRFDPDRDAPFMAFAVRAIVATVRQRRRGCSGASWVPHPLEGIGPAIGPAIDTLVQRLGRMPTAREIADEIGADPLVVTRAMVNRR